MNVSDVENNPQVLEYLYNLLAEAMEMYGFIGEKNPIVTMIARLNSMKVLHELAVHVRTNHSAVDFTKLMLMYPRHIREQEHEYFRVMDSQDQQELRHQLAR